MIIAVDFDGTLCMHEFPKIGPPNINIIESVLYMQANGATLILWTCRGSDRLQAAVDWCATYGLVFDAINENVPEGPYVEQFKNEIKKSGKIYADFYLDDKNMSLDEITEIAREYKEQK